MDNNGVHNSPEIKNWLARHSRFHAHFTPTSASWLNQVKRWFATLAQKYIRRGILRSTRQLEKAFRRHVKVNNADPKPFVWDTSPTTSSRASRDFVCELLTHDTNQLPSGALATLRSGNGLGDQCPRFFGVTPSRDLHPLARFEILVVREEVFDLTPNDLR